MFSDAELFLLEQYDRLGTRCDQMSSLGDRFVGLYLTLSIAVVGLGVKHLSHAGLAIVPLVWGSVTLILIRTYKEVFVLGGARRAIEEVLCERNIPLFEERTLVASVIRTSVSTVPYVSMIALFTAGSFAVGIYNYHEMESSKVPPGLSVDGWWPYLIVCLGLIVSLCGATISALNADENSFRSSLVEIRRSNYFAEPAIGETSVVRQDIDRKIQLRNIRKFLMKFSKF